MISEAPHFGVSFQSLPGLQALLPQPSFFPCYLCVFFKNILLLFSVLSSRKGGDLEDRWPRHRGTLTVRSSELPSVIQRHASDFLSSGILPWRRLVFRISLCSFLFRRSFLLSPAVGCSCTRSVSPPEVPWDPPFCDWDYFAALLFRSIKKCAFRVCRRGSGQLRTRRMCSRKFQWRICLRKLNVRVQHFNVFILGQDYTKYLR